MLEHTEETFPSTWEIVIIRAKGSVMATGTNTRMTFLKVGSTSNIDLTNSILIDIMNHQPMGKKTRGKIKRIFPSFSTDWIESMTAWELVPF